MVRLWDSSGRPQSEFTGHVGTIGSVSFSPESERIVTSGADGMVRLWDLSGRQLAEFSSLGRLDRVRFVDETQIVTASTDGTIGQLPVEGLNELLDRGCEWLKDYLDSHPNAPKVCPSQ